MYKALIAKVKVLKHPNADKLAIGKIGNYQVIIGKDTLDGSLGIFFANDGQLSEEYVKYNNLISYTDEKTGEKKGGYFPRNRRVRAQKFRGEISEGYWAPIDSLNFIAYDLSKLKEGDQFDSLGGVSICKKYITKATQLIGNSNKKEKRIIKSFPEHAETLQLKREVDNIKPGSIIYVTEKLHGSSGRFGYVPVIVEHTLSFWSRLCFLLAGGGWQKKKHKRVEYQYVNGSRRVVLTGQKEGFHGRNDFREEAVKPFRHRLFKGEVVYFEIVGYVNGKHIMNAQDTTKLRDKKFTKQYGKFMTYTYGQPKGTCKIYVYRITNVNEDGDSYDLPWLQVKRRCKELGVEHAPEIGLNVDNVQGFRMGGRFKTPSETCYSKNLLEYVEEQLEKPSIISMFNIREGVVVRVEDEDGVKFLKHKSFTFGLLEGYLKENDNYVDIEESS